MREDIGALKCLREESENVVDDQQRRLGFLRAGGVCLHAIDSDPLALLLVAVTHDWRDAAASLGLCRHVRKPSRTLCLGWMFETCSDKVVYGV